MGKSDKTDFSLAKGLALLSTLVYVFLATYRLGFQSLWYDEGLTLHYSSLPLVQGLGELAQQSVHPPLYFALMHFWLDLAGDSDYSLRFLSVAFGALFVSASYALGTRLANRHLGVLLALVTAISPFVVYYGQEARMYTMVSFLCALSAAAALRIVREGRGYLGYTVASAMAVLTHYFAFLVLGSEAVILVPLLFVQRRYRDLAKWLGTLALAAATFAPWAASLFRVATTHEDFWREKLSFQAMAQDAVLHFSLGEVAWSDNYLVYIFYAAAAVGLVGLLRRSLRLAVGVSAVALVASFLALVLFPKATYVARYVLVVAPAFYLLVAAGVYNLGAFLSLGPIKKRDAGVEQQPGRELGDKPQNENWLTASGISRKAWGYTSFCSAVVLVLFLVGSNAISLLTGFFDPASFRREDFKAMAQYLEPKLKPGDGMVFVAGPLNYALFHYLPATPSVWVDSANKLTAGDSLPQLDSFLKREDVKRVWLLRSRVSADDLVDPDRITQQRVMERFGVMTALKDVRGLVVEAYDRDLYDHYKAGKQIDIIFGDEVQMPRYHLSKDRLARGDKLEVELFWEPVRPVSRLLWVSVQLAERSNGQMVALADFPAGDLVPTTTWGPGMRIADKAVLSIPNDASLGDYDAYLIFYDPATKQRLAVRGGLPGSTGEVAKLFSVSVANP